MAATAMAKPRSVIANFIIAVLADVVFDWMVIRAVLWQISGHGAFKDLQHFAFS